jgi:hypothetical protein
LKETTNQNANEQFCNSSTSCHVRPASMHRTKVLVCPATMHNNYAQKQNKGPSSSSNYAQQQNKEHKT